MFVAIYWNGCHFSSVRSEHFSDTYFLLHRNSSYGLVYIPGANTITCVYIALTSPSALYLGIRSTLTCQYQFRKRVREKTVHNFVAILCVHNNEQFAKEKGKLSSLQYVLARKDVAEPTGKWFIE